MSGRAGPNPRAIGLFVLGGIVLAVLGLIVFGGSLLLQPWRQFRLSTSTNC